jgi:hypothetical protein
MHPHYPSLVAVAVVAVAAAVVAVAGAAVDYLLRFYDPMFQFDYYSQEFSVILDID